VDRQTDKRGTGKTCNATLLANARNIRTDTCQNLLTLGVDHRCEYAILQMNGSRSLWGRRW